MRLVTKKEAMRILESKGTHAKSKLPFCTGQYKWHGSQEATVRELGEMIDVRGVVAVYPERRQDRDGAYTKLRCIVDIATY